jgi:hypothetical protein
MRTTFLLIRALSHYLKGRGCCRTLKLARQEVTSSAEIGKKQP